MSDKKIWIAHVKSDKGEAIHLSELLDHQMFDVLNNYFENESSKGLPIAEIQTQMVRRADIVLALLSFGMDEQELTPQLQEAAASSKPLLGVFLSEGAPIAYELKNTNIAQLLRGQDHIELHAVNGFRNLLGRIHLLLSSPPPPSMTEPPFEAYSGQEPYMFVSYSHKDSALVYPEINRLHQLGFRIWYDEGIDPGNEWPEEVAIALEMCSFFLVFITSRSVVSKNVRNEINFAINHEKPFLAIHVEETVLPKGLELRMGDIQAILRWRMKEDRYFRQIGKTLPENLLVNISKLENIPPSPNDLFTIDKAWKTSVLLVMLLTSNRLNTDNLIFLLDKCYVWIESGNTEKKVVSLYTFNFLYKSDNLTINKDLLGKVLGVFLTKESMAVKLAALDFLSATGNSQNLKTFISETVINQISEFREKLTKQMKASQNEYSTKGVNADIQREIVGKTYQEALKNVIAKVDGIQINE